MISTIFMITVMIGALTHLIMSKKARNDNSEKRDVLLYRENIYDKFFSLYLVLGAATITVYATTKDMLSILFVSIVLSIATFATIKTAQILRRNKSNSKTMKDGNYQYWERVRLISLLLGGVSMLIIMTLKG
ncbi:hypothetical protein ACR56S_04580 [Staphylococcus hominis]|uniref:hypothetical protein n=1 Tax=Staphylococcus hominis TaxID=1290 RepID=UPI003D9FB33D